MLPAPLKVVLPKGGIHPVIVTDISSGNTHGAVLWTDGKMEAPMLPDEPWLLKSPDDDILFWTDECRDLLEHHPHDDPEPRSFYMPAYFRHELPPHLADASYAEEPSLEDLRRLLLMGIDGWKRRKIRHLRQSIWWMENDQFRRRKKSPRYDIANLDALLSLLKKTPEDTLGAAEIHRNIGRFGECLALLDREWPDELKLYADLIRDRALAGDRHVASLPMES